jgi:hypothetical protein
VSNRSVMISACDRVKKLTSGCRSLRRRAATGIAFRIARPDGRVGCPFMKGKARSIAASSWRANASHARASFCEKYFSSSAVRAGSFQNASDGPSESRWTWNGSAMICLSP